MPHKPAKASLSPETVRETWRSNRHRDTANPMDAHTRFIPRRCCKDADLKIRSLHSSWQGTFNVALIYLGVYVGKNWDTIKPAGTAELALVGVLAIVVGWLLIKRRNRRNKTPQ